MVAHGVGHAARNIVLNTMTPSQVNGFLQQKTITPPTAVVKRKDSKKKTTALEDIQAIVLNAGRLKPFPLTQSRNAGGS